MAIFTGTPGRRADIKGSFVEEILDTDLYKAMDAGEIEVYEEEGINAYFKAMAESSSEDPDALEKAKKDISKLVRKTITTKAGHKKTVWVKPVDAKTSKTPAKKEESLGDKAKRIVSGWSDQETSDYYHAVRRSRTKPDEYTKLIGVELMKRLHGGDKTSKTPAMGMKDGSSTGMNAKIVSMEAMRDKYPVGSRDHTKHDKEVDKLKYEQKVNQKEAKKLAKPKTELDHLKSVDVKAVSAMLSKRYGKEVKLTSTIGVGDKKAEMKLSATPTDENGKEYIEGTGRVITDIGGKPSYILFQFTTSYKEGATGKERQQQSPIKLDIKDGSLSYPNLGRGANITGDRASSKN